ncbi:MAG: hypothetical protein Q7S74_01035 [Nanoarchaeota archaeon]|nr:hypothetical protein [Nanoarchaeota archaeon]
MFIKKRAQEEMVGFVLIVVLVAIIFLVFIGITVRQSSRSTPPESIETSQFLDALLETGTNCAIDYEPKYSNIGVLISNCNDGRKCTSGKTACDILSNYTLIPLLDASWPTGPDRLITGYEFKIISETGTGPTAIRKTLFTTKQGIACVHPATQLGTDKPLPGKITVSFYICEDLTKKSTA